MDSTPSPIAPQFSQKDTPGETPTEVKTNTPTVLERNTPPSRATLTVLGTPTIPISPETVEQDATVSPTPTKTLAPAPCVRAQRFSDHTDLIWEWSEKLGPDDYFQVEIEHDSPKCRNCIIDVVWLKDNYYTFNYPLDATGESRYYWRISVVRGTPNTEKAWSSSGHRIWNAGPEFQEISKIADPKEWLSTCFP